MALDYSWDFTVAAPIATGIIINEVDADTPSTDVAEFVELYDGGAGNTSLTGLVVVLFNGNGDISYAAFDLDGRSTDGSGYFVICGNAQKFAVIDVTRTDLIQNGADAVALAANGTDFPTEPGSHRQPVERWSMILRRRRCRIAGRSTPTNRKS